MHEHSQGLEHYETLAAFVAAAAHKSLSAAVYAHSTAQLPSAKALMYGHLDQAGYLQEPDTHLDTQVTIPYVLRYDSIRFDTI